MYTISKCTGWTIPRKVISMYGIKELPACWEIEEIPKAWVWHHRAGPLSIVHYYQLVHILLPLPTHSHSPIDNKPLIDTCLLAPHLLWRCSYSIVLFCPFLMCCVQELRTKHVLSQARVPARPPKPPRDVNVYYCNAPRGYSVLTLIFLKLWRYDYSLLFLIIFSLRRNTPSMNNSNFSFASQSLICSSPPPQDFCRSCSALWPAQGSFLWHSTHYTLL